VKRAFEAEGITVEPRLRLASEGRSAAPDRQRQLRA